LANRGWSKQKVMDYIVDKAIVPDNYYRRLGLDAAKIVGKGLMTPDSADRLFIRTGHDPNPVKVFVFGGFGSWVGLIQGGPAPIVMKADLPKDWPQLVMKYKNLVPDYIKY
jgi:hypothetical protein